MSESTKRGSWKSELANANRSGSSIFHSLASRTRVPTRLRLRSNPFDSRTFVASRITVRLTPYWTHNSDSLGKYSLGWISPDSILRANAATISRWTRGFRFLEPLSAIGASVFFGSSSNGRRLRWRPTVRFSPDCCPFWWASYMNRRLISYEMIDKPQFLSPIIAPLVSHC